MTYLEYEIPNIASRLISSSRVTIELQAVDVSHGVTMPIFDSQIPIAGADEVVRPSIATIAVVLDDLVFGGLA